MRAYRVAYDGRPFRGFQRQPDVPTVEDAVFDALRGLDVLGPTAAKPDGYAAAGRTDAGVSARAQTVAFEAPEWLTPRAFNSELPETVRAWASADVSPDFHATHDARAREYVYHLYAPAGGTDRPTTPSLGDELARETLATLAGEHDFHNLTPDETGTVRTLETALERDGAFLVLTLRAGGFARQLVRRIVGLVREVASGESPPEKAERVLATEPLDGPEGVAPAPAAPLVLRDVAYGVDFETDRDAAANAREAFADRRAAAATAARVADRVRRGIDPDDDRF